MRIFPTLLEVASPMITILCVYVVIFFCLQVCMCTICMQYAQRPERGVDHLGLQLQTIVNCYVDAGFQTWEQHPHGWGFKDGSNT